MLLCQCKITTGFTLIWWTFVTLVFLCVLNWNIKWTILPRLLVMQNILSDRRSWLFEVLRKFHIGCLSFTIAFWSDASDWWRTSRTQSKIMDSKSGLTALRRSHVHKLASEFGLQSGHLTAVLDGFGQGVMFLPLVATPNFSGVFELVQHVCQAFDLLVDGMRLLHLESFAICSHFILRYEEFALLVVKSWMFISFLIFFMMHFIHVGDATMTTIAADTAVVMCRFGHVFSLNWQSLCEGS